jgi:anti-sigma B factor antagonist
MWTVPGTAFSVRSITVGDVSVLAVCGALDMLTAPTLTEAIDATVVAEGPRALIIDLAEVDFMSTAGIVALISADDKLETVAPVSIVADGPATSRVFALVGLDRFLRLYPTLDIAMDKSAEPIMATVSRRPPLYRPPTTA